MGIPLLYLAEPIFRAPIEPAFQCVIHTVFARQTYCKQPPRLESRDEFESPIQVLRQHTASYCPSK